jgi:hypothetical protein
MLFNSYLFIFGFLPFVLLGFYLLGERQRDWALLWLTVASLVFYAWWRPINVLLIAPSILINYGLARALQHAGETRPTLAKAILTLGIVFNICFLGYFKYRMFIEGSLNDVFGTGFILTRLILPLGISFITFQKIAFLVDVQAGRVTQFSLRDYGLFVLFFPQLIAGPIVHYREMMPQFRAAPCRFDATNVSVGITLFSFGLAKKTAPRRPARQPGRANLRPRRRRHPRIAHRCLDRRAGLHLADLFRLLRLYRHGARAGPIFRDQAAVEFQLAAQGAQHHRLLAALACQPHPLPHRVYLQPLDTEPHPPPRRTRQGRIRWP